MTTVKLFTINCDAEDHVEGCPWWIGNERSLMTVRRIAKEAGWVHARLDRERSYADYSPQCWKACNG